MIVKRTDMPLTNLTFAPRFDDYATIDRCGVIIFTSLSAFYYNDPAALPLAGVGVIAPTANMVPYRQHRCWVRSPAYGMIWYQSFVVTTTGQTLFIDPVAAYPDLTMIQVTIKVVKYWTDT